MDKFNSRGSVRDVNQRHEPSSLNDLGSFGNDDAQGT